MPLRDATLLILALVGLTSPGLADTAMLPTPPRPVAAWTPPPTDLPRFLVRATTALFEQGLADPRGCEYRRIQVAVGSVWGGQGADVWTSGWVLPAEDGHAQRRAVAWSGLVYPLKQLGDAANLDADVRALQEAAAPPNDRRGGRGSFHVFGTNNEASSIAVESLHPIKVCLLLRLGRARLAEAVWAAGIGPAKKPASGRIDTTNYGISYLTLATDLAWYRFDRALGAHMRRDDETALSELRALDALVKAVEAKADAMGYDRPARQARPGKVVPYIDFVNQLPEFLADQERRGRERADADAARRDRNKVANLIRALDQVDVRQWGQPGAVVLGQSPTIKDLIAEGDAAVEPLIAAFRSDNRLTRSVAFHRDFTRQRTILRVDQAIFTALTGILKTTNFAPPGPAETDAALPTRKALADEIQAYWEKNRAVPLVERWYRTLADDQAGGKAWLEAAGSIIRPENVRLIAGGGAFTVTEASPLARGERPVMRGEALRRGHEPTVAALMALRVETMLKTPEGQRFEMMDSCRMATMLLEWDPAAALPTLRDLTRICRDRYAVPAVSHTWERQNLALSIVRFTLARDRGGDADAIREYADWVKATRPEFLEEKAVQVLAPLLDRPDEPTLASAAAWLFGDPQSHWVPLLGRPGSRPNFHVVELVSSRLLDIPAFRALIVKSLDDRTPVGTVELNDNGGATIKLEGTSQGPFPTERDPDAPAPGSAIAIRACDLYGFRLATLAGAPRFRVWWPESKRNAALIELAGFLKQRPRRSGPIP